MVEVGRGEPVRMAGRVAVLTVAQIAVDDVLEARLEEKSPREAVEQRGEPRDGGREHGALRLHDAPCLRERRQAVLAFGQVVERTEEQNRVEGCLLERELARVADL